MKTSLCFCLLLVTSLVCLSRSQDDDCETFKADLVFALDVSGSLGQSNFNLMVDFVRGIIERLKIGGDFVRVGLLTFSTDAHVVFLLGEHTSKAGVLNHMSTIDYKEGTTHTEKALALLKDEMYSGPGNRPDVADVVVIITDGKSTKKNDTLAELQRIRNENYTIFVLGIGDNVDDDEINAISSEPDSYFSLKVEFDALANITQSFTEGVCEALNPPLPPPKAAKNCGSFMADIVFVLDSSASMSEEEFRMMLTFVSRIVETLEVGDNGTRVGLFTFSTKTSIGFHLSDYSSTQDVIDKVQAIPYHSGLTYTNLALDLLPVMFNDSGNRPDAQDIAILLSDGKSTKGDKTLESLANIREYNYTIFTLGIGDSVNQDELDAISSDPDSTYAVHVKGFEDLKMIVDAFASQVCEETNSPSCGVPQADIVIVLDSSGSIKRHNFEKVKDFLAQIIQQFKVSPDEVRVALMTFANRVKTEFYLDTFKSKPEVLAAIKGVTYTKGKTYTDKALKHLREEMLNGNGNREDVQDVVIVLTDGQSTKPGDTKNEVEELKKQNYTVFAIGIGDNIDKDELNSISSDPDQFFTSFVEDFDSLEDIESSFSQKACNATPPESMMDMTTTSSPACSVKADLVIVMDASSSIGQNDHVKMKTFVKNIIESFEIGPDDVRISLIVFNSHAYIEFYLDTYQTKMEILNAVDNAHGISRGTYTHLALNVTRNAILLPSNGNRPKVPDVVVLLTDGKSSQPVMTDNEAEKLRNMGAHILVLGIGRGVEEKELKSIASDPDDQFVHRAENFDQLPEVLSQLVEVTCDAMMMTTTLDPPLPTACGPFGDLVIMVDISTSVGVAGLGKVKHVIKDIIEELDIGENKIRVAVVTYDLLPTILLTLEDGDSKDDVLDALDKISQPGYGSWADRAFHDVRTQILQRAKGERPTAHDIILLFSDGLTRNAEMAILEAEKIKENGAKIITVGTDGFNKHTLRALSSSPSDDFFFTVKDFDGVDRIKELLEDKTCESEVKCGVEADIVVIMDSSTSIQKEDFMKMKDFIKHLLSGFEIGPDRVRVGMATYNYDAVMEFQLNSFSTKMQVLRAVDAISGQGTDTQTAKALKLVREVMFSEDNGNRPDVPDIAIVLSDGRSRDREETIAQAVEMHKEGIRVFAIGIGDRVSEMELYAIASSPPDEFVFEVKDFQGLPAIEKSLQRKTCGMPPGMNPEGIKLQADIMFVFDCSSHVLELNFEWALELASQIVRSVRVGRKWARFGAIKFSTDAVLEMTLDSYWSRDDIVNALDQIERSGWESRVEKALRQLRTLAFKDCLGGRPDVPDVAIIFTSGPFTHVDAARYEALLARNTGMKIFAIGIGKQVDKFELEIVTSTPYSNTVFVGATREELHVVQAQLLHELDSALNVCY